MNRRGTYTLNTWTSEYLTVGLNNNFTMKIIQNSSVELIPYTPTLCNTTLQLISIFKTTECSVQTWMSWIASESNTLTRCLVVQWFGVRMKVVLERDDKPSSELKRNQESTSWMLNWIELNWTDVMWVHKKIKVWL